MVAPEPSRTLEFMSTEPVPFEVETLVLDLDPDRRAVLYPVLDALRDAMPEGYLFC
jgi:hypothetical protein